MTKNEFKQGDKVATTKCYDIALNGYSTTIPIGEVGVIEDVYEDELYVHISEYNVYLTLPISEVEFIQPLDRKTAFLRELQALLHKYDAEIHDGEMYYISIDIDANSENKQEINYNLSEMDKWWLDADNIMDFDKE